MFLEDGTGLDLEKLPMFCEEGLDQREVHLNESALTRDGCSESLDSEMSDSELFSFMPEAENVFRDDYSFKCYSDKAKRLSKVLIELCGRENSCALLGSSAEQYYVAHIFKRGSAAHSSVSCTDAAHCSQ